MAKIKGILFDKDGTLFHYAHVWGPIVSRSVRKGLDTFSLTEEEKTSLGIRIEQIFGIDRFGVNHPKGMLFRHDLIPLNALRLVGLAIHYNINPFSLYTTIMDRVHHIADNLVEDLEGVDFPGVKETIGQLYENGYRIGLVTSDYEWSTGVFLEKMGIKDMVSFVRCHDTKGCRNKPNPEAIEQFGAQFGFAPEEIAMVGDTIGDMNFAMRGGCGYRIAVLTGSNDVPGLRKRSNVIYEKLGDIRKDKILFPTSTEEPVAY